MDPIAGLLSPQNRRNAKNQGLLAAGLNLLSNSGWKPIREDRGTLANFADAATAGLGAYQSANARALEVQDYEQQIVEQRAQKEALEQQRQRMALIGENLARQPEMFRNIGEQKTFLAEYQNANVERQGEMLSELREGQVTEHELITRDDGSIVAIDPTNPGNHEVVMGDVKQGWKSASPALKDSLMLVSGKPLGEIPMDFLDDPDSAAAVSRAMMERQRAGGTNIDITNEMPGQATTNALNEGMRGVMVDDLTNAVDAVPSEISSIQTVAQTMIDSDGTPITGFMADGRITLNRLGQFLGLSTTGMEDDEALTQGIQGILGQRMFDVLASGALGSGSGISDKDMEVAAEISGVSDTLTNRGRMTLMYLQAVQKSDGARKTIMQNMGNLTDPAAIDRARAALAELPTTTQIRAQFARLRADGSTAQYGEEGFKPLLDWVHADYERQLNGEDIYTGRVRDYYARDMAQRELENLRNGGGG